MNAKFLYESGKNAVLTAPFDKVVVPREYTRAAKAATVMMSVLPMLVLATGNTGTADAQMAVDLTANIIKIVCWIFRVLGIFLLAPGILQLVLAYRDDNANEATKHVRTIAVGIALVIVSFMIPQLKLEEKINNLELNGTT